jgi:hypothetical protein
MLTQERLKHLLSYDPETGVFRNRVDRGCAHAGEIAGSPRSSKRYLGIRLDGVEYSSHRLAWFYVYGEWPKEIDHKDRNKFNNAIANLRSCNRSQNEFNTPSRPNMYGLRGVEFYPKKKNKRFGSRIKVNGERIFLGLFLTPEDAHLAYLEAAKKYYGEFAEMHLSVVEKSQ